MANISEDASHAGEIVEVEQSIEMIRKTISGNVENVWEKLLRAKAPKDSPKLYGPLVSCFNILARMHFKKALSRLWGSK